MAPTLLQQPHGQDLVPVLWIVSGWLTARDSIAWCGLPSVREKLRQNGAFPVPTSEIA
jgi:hypothetical protein